MCFLYLFGRHRLMCYLCFRCFWVTIQKSYKTKTSAWKRRQYLHLSEADPTTAACIGDTLVVTRDRRNAWKKTRKQDTPQKIHNKSLRHLFSYVYSRLHRFSWTRVHHLQHLKCYLPLTHRSTVLQRFLVLSS